jgi:RIO-like serine/threonine protein kinase
MNDANKLHTNASLPQHLRKVNKLHQHLNKSQNSAWILHQIVRSELEYSLRLFEPRAAKHPEPFKTNRHGWIMPKESRQERQFFKSILSKKSFNKRYIKAYEKFLRQCQIKNIVEKASIASPRSKSFVKLIN